MEILQLPEGQIRRRKRNTSFVVFNYLIATPAIVCLLVNYSISHTITWALYPLGALSVIWSTAGPSLFLRKYNPWVSFGGFAVSSINFLFLIHSLSRVQGWMFPLALPVACIALAGLFLSIVAFAWLKRKKLYAVAATIFIFGVIVTPFIEAVVGNFVGPGRTDIAEPFVIGVSLAISLLFAARGYFSGRGKKH